MSAAAERLSGGPVAGRLASKVALVTGAGNGQGQAVAMLFAEAGATVVASDFNPAMVEETRRLAARQHLGIEMSLVDASDEAAVTAWVDGAAARYGGIDILYNNAATAHFASFATMTLAQFQETVRLELNVIFVPTRAAWRHLVARGGGSIINIASISGMRGVDYLGAAGHAAGKGGVIGLTRQLAVEGAADWIRVNSISPGPIRTPVIDGLIAIDPGFEAGFNGLAVLGRTGRAVDIAYAGLYLASDESAFVSGINLPVDGGCSSKASHTDH